MKAPKRNLKNGGLKSPSNPSSVYAKFMMTCEPFDALSLWEDGHFFLLVLKNFQEDSFVKDNMCKDLINFVIRKEEENEQILIVAFTRFCRFSNRVVWRKHPVTTEGAISYGKNVFQHYCLIFKGRCVLDLFSRPSAHHSYWETYVKIMQGISLLKETIDHTGLFLPPFLRIVARHFTLV